MCSRLMVIGEVASEDAVEVRRAEGEHVIQTLAPDRTDQALRKGVLPGAVRRREHLLDPHALYAVPKWLTVDVVAVAEKIGWGGVVREGVHELLGGPVGGGVLGHVEVDDPPAVVSEHDEDEEDANATGGHGEEVDRDHVRGRGWRGTSARSERAGGGAWA
jgi:hypothetical protein